MGGPAKSSASDRVLTYDELAELYHFGIKGMKWGVRRKNPSGSGVAQDPDAARARTTFAKIQKSGVASVTSADLQHMVNRLNLEIQYSRVAKAQQEAAAASKKSAVFFRGLKSATGNTKAIVDAGNTVMSAHKLLNSLTGISVSDLRKMATT